VTIEHEECDARRMRSLRFVSLLCSLALGCTTNIYNIYVTSEAGPTDAASTSDAGFDAAPVDATSANDAAPMLDTGPRNVVDGGWISDASITFVPLDPVGGGMFIADDLTYGSRIGRVILPTSNALQLLDPATLSLEVVPGFGPTWDAGPGVDGGGNPPLCAYDGGPGAPPCYPGTTSADDGNGVVYAIDRRSESVMVVDVAAGAITATTHLAGSPDFIRFSPSTSEIWITEPSAAQIEVLSVGTGTMLAHVATIHTPNGCESIGIDSTRGRAYSNAGAQTIGYDLSTHVASTTWTNGCTGSSGLAVDPRGFVVVICDDGHFVSLDATSGAQLSMLASPGGQIDVIAISQTLHHVYAQSNFGSLVALGLDSHGMLTMLGAPFSTQLFSKGVGADATGHVYVIDRMGGQVMVMTDPFAATM
jgi:hypothetical protein